MLHVLEYSTWKVKVHDANFSLSLSIALRWLERMNPWLLLKPAPACQLHRLLALPVCDVSSSNLRTLALRLVWHLQTRCDGMSPCGKASKPARDVLISYLIMTICQMSAFCLYLILWLRSPQFDSPSGTSQSRTRRFGSGCISIGPLFRHSLLHVGTSMVIIVTHHAPDGHKT